MPTLPDSFGRGAVNKKIADGWVCEYCSKDSGLTYEPVITEDDVMVYHVIAYCNSCTLAYYNVKSETEVIQPKLIGVFEQLK